MKHMRQANFINLWVLGATAFAALSLSAPQIVSAHCDTLDGPVVQDARKAIETGNVAPVLKWVKPKDEPVVRAEFKKVLADKTKHREKAEHKFFTTLVRIHRAGEGAPFTGLKPAGAVEPAVTEADNALASGSYDALLHLIAGDITAGVKERYERAAEAYKHKDESVAQGREFVEAYVEFTHYVERLHLDATGKGGHGQHQEHESHHKDADHLNH